MVDQMRLIVETLKLRADTSVLFSSIGWQYFIVLRHKLSKFKFSNLQLII